MPWPVVIAYFPPYGAGSALVAKLAPRAERAIAADAQGRPLAAGGFIVATASDGVQLLSGPYQLVPQHKVLAVGAAVYDDGGYGENFFNLHADLQGVNLTNHFSFPLELWFKGNLVGVVGPADGRGYFSNSGATLYFDNAGDGLRLGDVLSIRVGKDLLYDLTLVDTHTQTIHIGATAAYDG